MKYLDLIADFLVSNGIDIEDYTDDESQYRAIIDGLEELLEYKYKYLDLCK